MELALDQNKPVTVSPRCPVFGQCGGCAYQHLAYADELKNKEQNLHELFRSHIKIPDISIHPIIPSPKTYHYRNRLDLKLKKTRHQDILVGFTPVEGKGIIPVEACYIADTHISEFIPQLKEQAIKRLPDKYRNANLTVRTGDDGRVFWGGIGRRSCALSEPDYLWTAINGKRIFYSLDTFFQGNLSILPVLFDVLGSLPVWADRPVLYDLYGGVGLFSVGLSHRHREAILIEENLSSLKVARHTLRYNQLANIRVIEGRVEDQWPSLLEKGPQGNRVIMVDPPRAGLSQTACQLLSDTGSIGDIIYLSCNPDSLVRDLKVFTGKGWRIERIIPFDFFPKTKHIETLVLLKQ